MKRRERYFQPGDWGLAAGPAGELMIGGLRAVDLAREFGTPLHVLNEAHIQETARHFRETFQAAYPAPVSVHFAFKCNAVPAVIQTVQRAGLRAEVMSPFELDLALRLGYVGREIVVNGPAKSPDFLRQCMDGKVRFIIIDSLGELETLRSIAAAAGRPADVLLRINPDFTPRRMNSGSATGSRRGCAFGLDLKAGEPVRALRLVRESRDLRFHGFHFHIGTGIRRPDDYAQALRRLAPLLVETRAAGMSVKVMDVGGGFASRTTRELTGRELLIYQGLERLPGGIAAEDCGRVEDFAAAIAGALQRLFPLSELPELVCEPGRSIASAGQFLLLTVRQVKERPKVRKWLITDGGLGTVTLPTFYEYHELFLADDVKRPRSERVTIIGPVCFASDVVYRNIRMPRVSPGEVIAVMDSGAYFTALESSFSFNRPAIVSVKGSVVRRIRRAETFADMVERDCLWDRSENKEVCHEIRSH